MKTIGFIGCGTMGGALARAVAASGVAKRLLLSDRDGEKAAALAANAQRIPLAKMAVAETGMGVAEDKVIKNNYAAEYIYNAYRDEKTCGVIEENAAMGIRRIAEPVGVIGAVIPTTNPTSTAIFKTLLALKTRNGIIISPHPRAKGSTIEAARIVLEKGIPMYILNGKDPTVLYELLDGRHVGTYFAVN